MPINIHNKPYTTVAERLQAVHTDWDQISITTEILDDTEKQVTVKAVLEIDGRNVYHGMAREYIDIKNTRAVNFANALENAETSAVGRALSKAGYGGDERSSVEEIASITRKREAKESDLEKSEAQLEGKKPVVKTSTAANDKTAEKEVELLDTWRGMVIAAQEKFGAGNYKAAVHQKLVELFGPSSEGDYSSSYQRSEPAVTADQVKEFLVSFEVPDLHLACKELLTTEEKGNE